MSLKRTSVQLRTGQITALEKMVLAARDRTLSSFIREAIDVFLSERGDGNTGEKITAVDELNQNKAA